MASERAVRGVHYHSRDHQQQPQKRSEAVGTKEKVWRRRCGDLHREIGLRMLYQNDYLHLLVKYGLEAPSQLADADMPGPAAPLPFDPGRRATRPAAPDPAAESA